jgi:hypothetical protein
LNVRKDLPGVCDETLHFFLLGANSNLRRQKRVKDFDVISDVHNFPYQDLSNKKPELSILSEP